MSNDQAPFLEGFTTTPFILDELECELIQTADGSSSLRYRSAASPHWTEPMHSSKGAWAETLHVYEPALLRALSQETATDRFTVTSIGLGLGYNEILSAGWALKLRRSSENFRIISFENQSALRNAFEARFNLNSEASLPQSLSDAYKNILQRVCAHLSIKEEKLASFIEELFRTSALKLLGAVDSNTLAALKPTETRSNCVLFDAFSPESSPDLWDEPLLNTMVDTLCGADCVFASYASRTALKRALKSRGFTLEKVGGFAGKRERTFATRNILPRLSQ